MRSVLLFVLTGAAALQPAAAQRPLPPARPGPEIPPATPVPLLRPAPRDEAPRVPSWVSFGFGPSTRSPRGRPMLNTGIRLSGPLGVRSVVLDAGAAFAFETAVFQPNLFGGLVPSESVTEGHVAAGIGGRHSGFVSSVVVGPAFVRVKALELVQGQSRLVGRTYPGVYGSAQAVAILSRTVGLGAEAFGVLNAGHPTGGLRLSVAVGGLR